MLSQSFRWRVNADSAFLDYNAGNVAHIQRWRDELVLTIRWQGHTVGGRVGSLWQGVRYAERWIAARPGWPGKRPKRWYDRVAEQQLAAEAKREAWRRRGRIFERMSRCGAGSTGSPREN